MLGRSSTPDNGEFVAIALFRLKSASAATQTVHVLVDLWADCVCESDIFCQLSDNGGGPSSPDLVLLFFSLGKGSCGDRGGGERDSPSGALTQLQQVGSLLLAHQSQQSICGQRYSQVIHYSAFSLYFTSITAVVL